MENRFRPPLDPYASARPVTPIDPYASAQPIAPIDPYAASRGLRPGVSTQGVDPERGSFASGLRAGMVGTEVGLRALAANVAETVGAPEFAKSQLREISTLKNQMPQGEITSVGQIRNLSDVGDFAAYSTGQAIPTIATAVGGALAGRLGLRAAGARLTPGQAEFAGATAGVFPQEAGQAAARMYESPEAMERSAGARLGIAGLTGFGSSVLESVIPAAFVGRVARGAAPALRQGIVPAARYIGTEAAKAGALESATEVGQTLVGQAGMKLAAPRTEELLPSGEELLTAAAAGFLPGSALGGAGSTAEVLRSRAGGVADTLRSTNGNPAYADILNDFKPPSGVNTKDLASMSKWVQESGQVNNIVEKARAAAADESLTSMVRQAAERVVNTNGDPDALQTYRQAVRGAQTGESQGEIVGRLLNKSVFARFTGRPVNDERFSAMSVPLTEDDAPLVSRLKPYLVSSDDTVLQNVVPVLKQYAQAVSENPNAQLPAGLSSFFKSGKSQEGLGEAFRMMSRMGLLESPPSEALNSFATKQKAWDNLLDNYLVPGAEYSGSERRELVSKLEFLAANPSSGDADQFMPVVQALFGANAPTALDQIEALLPRQEPMTLDETDLTEKAGPRQDVYRFRTEKAGDTAPFDMQSQFDPENLVKAKTKIERSGTAEAIELGVVDFAAKTGQQSALQQARQAAPNLSDEQLNERFKVLEAAQVRIPESEVLTYDEILSKGRESYGSVRFYEPGGKAVRTTPARMIRLMRSKDKLQSTSASENSEQALSEFARALSAYMTSEKSGQVAFDRVELEVKGKDGVPRMVDLRDLGTVPDNFTIFQNVSVGDAKRALGSRIGYPVESEAGGRTRYTYGRTRKWTDPELRELTFSELRDLHTEKLEQYRTSVQEAKGMSPRSREAKALIRTATSAKKTVEAVRKEITRRLQRDGLNADPDSVAELLKPSDVVTTAIGEVTPTGVNAPTFLAPETETSAKRSTGEGQNILSETEEFGEGGALESARQRFGENITPGDVEATRQGPRFVQEETSDALQPREEAVGAPTAFQAASTAKQLLSVIEASNLPVADQLAQALSRAIELEADPVGLAQAASAIEKQAIAAGVMSGEDSFYRQRAPKKAAKKVEPKTAPKGEKFSSMDPLVPEQLDDESKAEINAWIDSVLPKFTLDFVKELGGMSGSYSRDALGTAVIKINMFASDPFGVAFHEAVHDLFVQLKEGGHQGVIDMLNRAATSPIMQRKLERLLAGNPGAIAQLKDPEEAAAYMFQFWMKDMLELGTKTDGLFTKILNAVKKFLNLLSDEQMARNVFELFNAGQLKDPISRDEKLTALGTPAHAAFMKSIEPITKQFGKLVNTVDARFRESGNPYLVNIIDSFNLATGSQSQKVGYYDAVNQARNRLTTRLNDQLEKYDSDQIAAALELLQQEASVSDIKDPAVRDIVKTVRDTLDKLYGYMERKGVTTWAGAPIGKVQNYFPRVWSIDTLVADGDSFVNDLIKYHEKELTEIAKTSQDPNETAQSVAEAIYGKITRNGGVMDDATNSPETGLKENQTILGFSPAMAAANKRVLKFLDMSVFSKYLEKDMTFSMTRYINQAVKRAEYSERFGSDGSRLEQMMEDAESFEIDKLLAKEYGPSYKARKEAALRGKSPVDKESQAQFETRVLSPLFADFAAARAEAEKKVAPDMDSYRSSVMALEGTLGHDISPELRKFNSAMLTYQNIRTIPLQLLSSFVDPLGIMVRGGDAKFAYRAFVRGMREVFKNWKGEFTGGEDPKVYTAQLMGTVEGSAYLESLGQMYHSSFMTGKARQINEIFFRVVGAEGWNRSMRVEATDAAIQFIKDQKLNPTKQTDRYLKELGLTMDDIVIKEDGSLDLSGKDKRLQFAIMKWVDGAILRPNAAQRPAWASNPKFALIFHLSQFTYSFQKVILSRMYLEAKNGNFDPVMLAAVGYVPVMIASNVIRAFIQGGGDEPEWMKNYTLVDWMKDGVQRSGILGVPELMYSKLPTGVAGPAAQQIAEVFVKDRELSEDIARAMPFNPVYRHW